MTAPNLLFRAKVPVFELPLPLPVYKLPSPICLNLLPEARIADEGVCELSVRRLREVLENPVQCRELSSRVRRVRFWRVRRPCFSHLPLLIHQRHRLLCNTRKLTSCLQRVSKKTRNRRWTRLISVSRLLLYECLVKHPMMTLRRSRLYH